MCVIRQRHSQQARRQVFTAYQSNDRFNIQMWAAARRYTVVGGVHTSCTLRNVTIVEAIKRNRRYQRKHLKAEPARPAPPASSQTAKALYRRQ